MRAKVWYLMDDTVCIDEHEGSVINTKIHKDGRGYIRVDGVFTAYRRVEKFRVEGVKSGA